MKGKDVTKEQLDAAVKFIQIVRPDGRKTAPPQDQWQAIKWEDLVRLVAHYGAVRAKAVANGGTVDNPGEATQCTGS